MQPIFSSHSSACYRKEHEILDRRVSTAARLWNRGQRNQSLIHGKNRKLFLSAVCPNWLWCSLSLLHNRYQRLLLGRIKLQLYETDHSPPYRAPSLNMVDWYHHSPTECTRIIFKNKHTLHGTLMKTGPVRDAQQTKQCDVTAVKQADLSKYTLRSTNITWHRVCFKNQN
jgi:hypothetical protein